MQPLITVTMNLIAIVAICSWMALGLAQFHWRRRGTGIVLVTIIAASFCWLLPGAVWSALGRNAPLAYEIAFANWIAGAFAIVLLERKTAAIPRDFAEAAILDGAGAIGIYWNVVLPLVLPELRLIAVLTLMASAPELLVDAATIRAPIAAGLPLSTWQSAFAASLALALSLSALWLAIRGKPLRQRL